MNFDVILIEIFTALLGLVIFVLDLVLPKGRRTGLGFFSAAALLIILAASFFTTGSGANTFFAGFYTNDAFSLFFKQLFLAGAVLVTLMSTGYVKNLQDNRGEFFALIIFALLGMMVMVSANDFITLYIGLELMTISFVILTSIDTTSVKSSEAGLKYIVLSAMSSAVLLYGLSIIYGVSGSVAFTDTISFMQNGAKEPAVLMAVVFILAGFGFKISAVPFHMWSPDVYEGAPTPVTAFLAIGSKAAALAVLIRLLLQVFSQTHATSIAILVVVMACLTMLVGNLIAIPQRNIKRMLAYSSIAHAGYILLGIVAFTKMSVSAMLYYLVLYLFANAGAFAAITALAKGEDGYRFDNLSGVWKRSPLITGALLISLLSMAGIPPAAGFIGKFYLFAEVVRQGYIWLAFFAIGTSVIAIYYYIIVIRVMLVGEAKDNTPVTAPVSLKIVMIVSSAVTLFLGVYPGPVTDWAARIASVFIK